jgi:hypothetical protein
LKLNPVFHLALLVIVLLVGNGQVFADPLKNAYKQRIGNYDFEMTTEPKNPVVDEPTKVLLRIAGVNGDDLVDVPITITTVKNGVELQRTNPIIVPYGHYAYEYTFAETGKYVLYVDLKDYSYSGETLTFTFFVIVAGGLDYLYVVVPTVAGVAAAGIVALVFVRTKRHKMDKANVE